MAGVARRDREGRLIVGLFDDDAPAPAEPPKLLPRRRVKAFRTATELPAPTTFEQALGALDDEARAFVEAYVVAPVATRAYLAVDPKADRREVIKGAARLMARHAVRAAIALGRKEVSRRVAEVANFNAEVAMQKLQDAEDYCRDTENGTALARILELQMRMTGVLVDKMHIKQETMQVTIHEQAPAPVDVTAIDVTPIEKGE
jgi:hypothetical protein